MGGFLLNLRYFVCNEWCLGPESNRHALRRRILSPLRLPISPPRQVLLLQHLPVRPGNATRIITDLTRARKSAPAAAPFIALFHRWCPLIRSLSH
jgi:hypothetical protein